MPREPSFAAAPSPSFVFSSTSVIGPFEKAYLPDGTAYKFKAQERSGASCKECGTQLAGRYQKFGKPFGARRIPVRLQQAA